MQISYGGVFFLSFDKMMETIFSLLNQEVYLGAHH